MDECPAHRDSDLGFLIRFARQAGLDEIGGGYEHYISFGAFDLPPDTQVRGRGDERHLIPAGFALGTQVGPLDETKVAEQVIHSFYADYEGGRHPSAGVTQPDATGGVSSKYSWAKAPRYDGLPAETGPLAEMVVARHPLFIDWLSSAQPNTLIRQIARVVRPAELIPAMEQWLGEITPDGTFYAPVQEIPDGEGFGITEAARGALGHWVTIADEKIRRYQIITPTAWNGSPRDQDGVRGPWEEALVGTAVKDPDNPVELGHVVRSFDPCLVCTVHAIDQNNGKTPRT